MPKSNRSPIKRITSELLSAMVIAAPAYGSPSAETPPTPQLGALTVVDSFTDPDALTSSNHLEFFDAPGGCRGEITSLLKKGALPLVENQFFKVACVTTYAGKKFREDVRAFCATKDGGFICMSENDEAFLGAQYNAMQKWLSVNRYLNVHTLRRQSIPVPPPPRMTAPSEEPAP